MADEAKPEKASVWKVILAWVGGASAVIGLFAAISGQLHLFEGGRAHKAELEAKMAVAQTQVKQGEYEAAVGSYGEVLKGSPLYGPAQDGQLDAAMLWVENFQVLGDENNDAAKLAGAKLDVIMPVLDAGLARAKGTREADVQAHLGWAHWLNWHIAEREFGLAAEKNLRAALVLDGSNVYANAMLGNWMLQNHGSFQEAIGHLNTAVVTGKARPLVRAMQIGGLLHDRDPGARAELIKAVNDMRKNNEPLDEDMKERIVGFCYSPYGTSEAELKEVLGAVPEDDGWKTYLWLDDSEGGGSTNEAQDLAHAFIHASLLEVAGKRAEALGEFRVLQKRLATSPGTVKDRVDDAVKRLSAG
jgi:tetratricopeptide (TPR) repeat protein